MPLRQSCARVGNAAEAQAGRYAHAQQWRRMRRETKRLRTWLGRVIRNMQRKASDVGPALRAKLEAAQRLYPQRRDSKNKLYALHGPEVECIAEGKVRTPYEFGVKVSVAVTAKEGSADRGLSAQRARPAGRARQGARAASGAPCQSIS